MESPMDIRQRLSWPMELTIKSRVIMSSWQTMERMESSLKLSTTSESISKTRSIPVMFQEMILRRLLWQLLCSLCRLYSEWKCKTDFDDTLDYRWIRVIISSNTRHQLVFLFFSCECLTFYFYMFDSSCVMNFMKRCPWFRDLLATSFSSSSKTPPFISKNKTQQNFLQQQR